MRNKNLFTHYADVEFTIFKSGSEFVPYDIAEVEIDATQAAGDMDVRENLDFVCHDMIALPKQVEAMTDEQCARIKAQLWGHFYSFETDCGTEYDADFELREETVEIRIAPSDAPNP